MLQTFLRLSIENVNFREGSKMIKKLLILLIIITIGCASQKEMRGKFEYGKILTDIDGNEYWVEHNLGDNYIITLIESE